MALTDAEYLAQLQALLPPGAAWSREPSADLTRLLAALADELGRIDGRADALLAELDPRRTAELLRDWERVAGLPDPCTGTDPTTAARRAALHTRLTTLGGQSAAYYQALAADLGFAITITEFRPHTVADDVETPLHGPQWRFWWQVNAALETITQFSTLDTVADPLAAWGNERLECLIRRLKPAHTEVIFAYA